MAILEVEHLEKRFGGTPVLQDVSFSLEQGRRWPSSAHPAAARQRCCAA